jgi:hypothetical protein
MHRVLAYALTTAASLAFASVALGGTISGQVFRDYNSNAEKNAGGYEIGTQARATDVAMSGITVRAFDNAGTQVGETTTAADGTYSLSVSASGTVRVEFSTPSGFQPSFEGTEAKTSVQFVDAAGATDVNYAVNVPGEYCQDNPDLVSCVAPYLSFGSSLMGAFTMPSAFSTPMTIGANGGLAGLPGIKGGDQVTTAAAIGSTFGLGVDRNGNAYYGTYVKRHAPYASSNSQRRNVVYKVNVGTGASAPFVTLGTEQLPAHDARVASGTNPNNSQPWPAYAVDGLRSDAAGQAKTDVYHQVGRAGLGDVDVSPEGDTLWAVEMTESAPKLWKVPIEGTGSGTTAGTPTSYPITAPTTFGSGQNAVTCEGTWHPMGLGISGMGDQMMVGGICGAENTTPKQALATWASSANNVATLEFTDDAAIDNISVGDQISLDSWKPASGPWWTWGNYPNPPFNAVIEQYYMVTVTGKTTVAGSGVASLSFDIPASWGDLSRTQLGINPNFTPGSKTSVYKAVVPNAFIMSFDQATGAFSTVFGFSMGYPKTGTSHKYVPAQQSLWSDSWQSWYDGNLRGLTVCAYNASEYPDWCRGTPPQWGKPMLANIEINGDGTLTLGFRDRMADQSAANTVDYESPSVSNPRMQADPSTAVADTVQVCNTGSGYALEHAGACGSVQGANVPMILADETQAVRDAGMLYWNNGLFEGSGVYHPQTSLGGTARMPGVKVLWSTTYDVSAFLSQGIRAMGPCALGDTTCGPRPADDGALLGGSDLETSGQPTYCGTTNSCWAKGNGLGDLEVLCEAAPLQIGNRVWIDTNWNGLQDADEKPVAGVTVRLYDSGGTLVGTAKTDAQGQYYFSSNVTTPAAGDGTNTGGGLKPGEAFTIRLDNPADFTGTGPLAPYVLTEGNVATAPAGAQPTLINSKASKVDGYPQISVTAHRSGYNDHTFDVGFIDPNAPPPGRGSDPNANAATTPVGMGDYTWIDTNRNGIQDPGEAPLPGVRVQLLNPDGSVARDFNGNPVGPVTTDARGYYLITNLRAGSYMARFTIPNGYAFTIPGAGTPGTDSNPTSFSANGLVGTTPVFKIYASTFETTTPFTGNLRALFANLTIDAGVVPLVAIGNFVWFDKNRDGVQGRNEKPVKGAKVYLLNPNGTRARDASGKPVKVATTDARGRYLFQGLLPGDYRVKFVFPKGYSGTIAGKGGAKNGSNPKVSPLTPRVGLTSTFRVFDAARGNTVRQPDPKVNAKFIDPTIDAGLILYGGGPQGVVG